MNHWLPGCFRLDINLNRLLIGSWNCLGPKDPDQLEPGGDDFVEIYAEHEAPGNAEAGEQKAPGNAEALDASEDEPPDATSEAESENDGDGPSLQTKAAFQALRSQYKSTYDFVLSLYREKDLQYKMRMLIDGCQDLHSEYSNQLAEEKSGYIGMLNWATKRANGAWYGTIVKMVQRLMDSATAARLGVQPATYRVVVSYDPQDESMKRDVSLLQQYRTLVLALASNRAWSQCFYGYCFPWVICRAMSQDEQEARRAVLILNTLSKAILKLEKMAGESPHNSTLASLLQSVGTHEWVITREVLACGLEGGWDLSVNSELRAMVFSFFAGPHSTKFLENTINHVKDAAARYNRNTRVMTGASKWLYAHTSNYANEQGLTQVRLAEADFTEFSQAGMTEDSFLKTKPYSLNTSTLKGIIPGGPNEILHGRRKAGGTNRESAAACAFICAQAEQDFAMAEFTWAGHGYHCLLCSSV